MPVPNPPELFAALGRGAAGFVDIKDTPESDWIDFKGEPYDLSSARGRFELAKDVAALAEARGGVIAIGIQTRLEPLLQVELADKLRPIPAEMTNVDQLRKLVSQLVYPPLDHALEISAFPMSESKVVLTIHIPPQDEGTKPFIVLGAVDEHGKQQGNVFGYFKRQGDASPPVPAQYVQSLLRDGRRLQRAGVAGFTADSIVQLLAGAPAATSAAAARSTEDGRPQLEADVSAAALGDVPYLAVQIRPTTSAEIEGLFEDGFRRQFLYPEQLRMNGFNLDFSADVETLRVGGLRKVRSGDISMSVRRDGLTTVVVGPRFLGWAQRGGSRINPFPLLEFVLEASRFTALVVKPRLRPEPARFHYFAALRNLGLDGPVALAPGLPEQWFDSDARRAAESATEVESELESDADPARATFGLLKGLYAGYGLPPSAIPFADTTRGVIRIEEFVSERG
jgi:hypothetical protein